jgi:hypothetical protein
MSWGMRKAPHGTATTTALKVQEMGYIYIYIYIYIYTYNAIFEAPPNISALKLNNGSALMEGLCIIRELQ